MTPFFVRLKLAFQTFFSILFRNHIPAEVAEVFRPAPAAPAPQEPTAASVTQGDSSAAQLLAVLQRDGRLIDFLMEDITPYADAQIGAAVRNVHAGCRQASAAVRDVRAGARGEEGSRVTVDAGTDAAMVKLIGNVTGQPPFSGVLRHRGWLVQPHGAAPARLPAARHRPGRSRSRRSGPSCEQSLRRRHRSRHDQLRARVRDAPRPRIGARTEVHDDPAAGQSGRGRPRVRCCRRSSTSLARLDFPAGSTALPWNPQPPHVIGELARKRGAENPARLVASAKSWLSYGGAQRHCADPALGRAGRGRRTSRRSTRRPRTCGTWPRRLTPVSRKADAELRARASRTCCSPCRPRSTRRRAS